MRSLKCRVAKKAMPAISDLNCRLFSLAVQDLAGSNIDCADHNALTKLLYETLSTPPQTPSALLFQSSLFWFLETARLAFSQNNLARRDVLLAHIGVLAQDIENADLSSPNLDMKEDLFVKTLLNSQLTPLQFAVAIQLLRLRDILAQQVNPSLNTGCHSVFNAAKKYANTRKCYALRNEISNFFNGPSALDNVFGPMIHWLRNLQTR